MPIKKQLQPNTGPTEYRIQIRSRHKTHNILRTDLPKLKFRTVVRLGSTTELEDTVTMGGKRVECNTVESIRNSSSKLRMKKRFDEGGVRTAEWWTALAFSNFTIAKQNGLFPVVAKSHYGSRGRGNTLIQNKDEWAKWLTNHDPLNYIVEKFADFNVEYRLHVTKDGCFYTNRKMLKNGTPKEHRWHRDDTNSVWIFETNPLFDKPDNWKTIEEHCVKALTSCGLDVGAVDVKVQSSKGPNGTRVKNPDFIILEINSAPGFGAGTGAHYLEQLPKILMNKRKAMAI